jgi:hypothetical protein
MKMPMNLQPPLILYTPCLKMAVFFFNEPKKKSTWGLKYFNNFEGVNSWWWVCTTTMPINYKPAPQPQLMFLQTKLESECLELSI